MAVAPEFFARRVPAGFAPDPGRGLAIEALLAAANAALAPSPLSAMKALRALDKAASAAPARARAALARPRRAEELGAVLDKPCGRWLPFAEELGIADERLSCLGHPTAASRDARLRYG